MKAVVLRQVDAGPAVEEVEIDDPRAGEVRVRMVAAGVCGTDVHVLQGTERTAVLPVVMGHEGSGIVEAVGAGVTGHRVGDPVVIALYSGCMRCRSCLDGYEVLCVDPEHASRRLGHRSDGSTTVRGGGTDLHPYTGVGAMAEYAVVPQEQAIRVPDDVPLDLLALAGCGLMTGLAAAFDVGKVAPGSSVAVIGCGGVGLSVIQGARIAGAARIVALDVTDHRLRVAGEVGATDLVDSSSAGIVASIDQLVPGGADVVFEAVGRADLVTQALRATGPGGTRVMVGTPQEKTLTVSSYALFANRHLVGTLAGSGSPARDIDRIVRLVQAGLLRLDAMVSARLPLDRGVEAICAAEAGTGARALITMA